MEAAENAGGAGFRMTPLSLVYILSLLVLGTLLALTLFRPLAAGREYPTVQKEQLLQTPSGWVVQFDLVNPSAQDIHYTIRTALDGERPYQEPVLVRAGGAFTYSQQIPAQSVTAGVFRVTIDSDRNAAPFNEAFYLK